MIIKNFEMYNQPLCEDPDSGNLFGPAMMAMRNNEDFMDHVRLTLIAIFGRKDLHKYQNTIEDGKTPSIELPISKCTIGVKPNESHSSLVPLGAIPTMVHAGNLHVMDWINYYMSTTFGEFYEIGSPSKIYLDDDGMIEVIGFTGGTWGYYLVYMGSVSGAPDTDQNDPVMEKKILSDYLIPLAPDGLHTVIYYHTEEVVEVSNSDINSGESHHEPPQGGTTTKTIASAPGIIIHDFCDVDFSFGEEGGEMIMFPPLPLRVTNENYYTKFDEDKQSDIRKLGNIFGINTKSLIDNIMDSDDVVGNEDKIDHIYLNYGVSIRDNSLATCRYLYLLFERLIEYGDECGSGLFSDCFTGLQPYTDQAVPTPVLPVPFTCNTISIESDEFFYEFGFSGLTMSDVSLDEIMSDDNLATQYDDRKRSSDKKWYLSSSTGDPSREDDYEQPEGAKEITEAVLNGTHDDHSSVWLSIYECSTSGITKITIPYYYGQTKIQDGESLFSGIAILNREDPNSILVPYIPAIGEKLTNTELSDCFTTSLQATIMVASVEIKKLPWWVYLIMVIVIIAIAWTGYGATGAEQVAAFVAKLLVTYVLGQMITGAFKSFGIIGGVVAMVVTIIVTREITSSGMEAIGMLSSSAPMKLTEILGNIFDIITKSFESYSSTDLLGDMSESEEEADQYSTLMKQIQESQNDSLEDRRTPAYIEPLIEDLLNTSIRTEVNPMSPKGYYSLYGNFNKIGTILLDVGNIYSDTYNINNKLQPS